MANSVTTIKAREKFAKAHAEGKAVPKITKIGWGTGGVDNTGKVKIPKANQTVVEGEFFKNAVATVEYPNKDSGNYLVVRFTGIITSEDTGALGKELSSCGLYDEEGTLIAVKNFSPKNIDADTRIEIQWNEEF